jgi:SH3-like domain-containing protein
MSKGKMMRHLRSALAIVALAGAGNALAVEPTSTGSVTGLAIPRYVSLKPSDTPMREGPSKEHRIKWVFKREGVPVEITAEFENWRRVRDSEGVEGWVFHSRLSARRTALIAPWSKDKTLTLHDSGAETAAVVAQLQPTVIASVETCNGKWCRISGEGFRGWMKQEQLWGVYPGELVK